MNKKGLMLTGIIIIFALLLLVMQPVAADVFVGEAGSSDDPVITKSYADEQIYLLKEYVDKELAGVKKDSGNADTEGQWETIQLQEGQTLEAFAGTELIVRTGKVTALAGESGIPDVTGGSDLTNGSKVPLNHHLIFPRSDGRGLNTEVKAWIMYKGEIDIN